MQTLKQPVVVVLDMEERSDLWFCERAGVRIRPADISVSLTSRVLDHDVFVAGLCALVGNDLWDFPSFSHWAYGQITALDPS